MAKPKKLAQLGKRIDRPAPETESPTATPPESTLVATPPESELVATMDPQSPELDPVDSDETESLNPEPSAVDEDSVADSRGPGRPSGSKNREYARGERKPGICPKCRCTDVRVERKSMIPTPHEPDFSHVELIRCCCKKCGQWRIDRQRCNPAD